MGVKPNLLQARSEYQVQEPCIGSICVLQINVTFEAMLDVWRD